MRHAITIDDKLMQLLESRAKAAGETLDVVADRAMRLGLFTDDSRQDNPSPEKPEGTTSEHEVKQLASKVPFVQRSYSMGKPLIDLTKANAIAYMSDEEIEEMAKEYAENPSIPSQDLPNESNKTI